MKKKPEYIEGNQALDNFDSAMTALMRVPHSEIKKKLDAEKQEKSNANRNTSRRKRTTRSTA